ncbi:exonuclease domain-containing protein [Alkalicoccus chagannorensis]|uniref:exonuclease domain-containing protein n=1 Tax=Alkalicoccus chagannorensis TaxID=427072 RepID=UPI000406DF36|nr:exonuclease domain-containing protein [Alkalicoccus chagannorensis]
MSVFDFFSMRKQPAHSFTDAARLKQLTKDQKYADHLLLPLEKVPAVVFDLETTGFRPEKGDEILSIGAVNLKTEKEFYSLVRTEKTIPLEVTQLTHISEADTKEAPPAGEVMQDFFSFAEGSTLIAHHAAHEKSFLQHLLRRRFGSSFTHRLIDTSFVASILPEMEGAFHLEDCCSVYDIACPSRHHALEDARVTAALWQCMMKAATREQLFTLKDIYSAAAGRRRG